MRLTTLPLIVQPNAGMPKEVDNRRIYLCSPEYLAEYAKRYVGLGAAAVGGCCGTTPEHIREIAAAIKPLGRATHRSRSIDHGRRADAAKPPAAVGRKIATRPAAGREPLGHERRIGAAARLRSAADRSKEQDAPRARRHRDQHSRRPPGEFADLAAHDAPNASCARPRSSRSCISAAATGT